MVGRFVNQTLGAAGFDPRTSMYLKFYLRRLYTRLKHHRRQLKHAYTKLHLGCGGSIIEGWLNCDVTGSDFDVDLAASTLPFLSNQFTVIVAKEVIEHLEFDPTGRPPANAGVRSKRGAVHRSRVLPRPAAWY